MALDLTDCLFQGPALPEPFVKLELEKELARLKLLPKTTGNEAKKLAGDWQDYRRKLRELGASGRPAAGAQPGYQAAAAAPGLCPDRSRRRCADA